MCCRPGNADLPGASVSRSCSRLSSLDGRVQEQGTLFRDLRQQMDARFQQGDTRFDTVNHHLAWLVGIVVTGFIAVIGVLASTAFR